MDGRSPSAGRPKSPDTGKKPPPKPARLVQDVRGDTKRSNLSTVSKTDTTTKGDTSKLERHLQTVLECPVCYEYMASPIFMCPNGHNLCGSCLTKCNELCPTCDMRIDSRRNLALEQLSVTSLYPCSYSNRGCPQKLPAHVKLSHEAGCAYRPLACPLVCGWRGRRDQLLSHVTMAHPGRYSMKNHDLPHFWQSITQSDCFQDYRHAVFAFGETFAYVRRFSMERRKMHLAVLLMGDPARASNFRYKFKMAKDDSDRHKSMSLACSVHSYDETLDAIFLKNSCITLDFETLVFYGNGPRSLKISKVQQTGHNESKPIVV
ncbi:E3 ubiquitin-protein ligase SIAH1B-like [Schistocerca nitens]|uniref:E3 ubiquitin-protein ligase SIAH1B-like n=1 Tax=Schistocerca nitens TaxID=7011 RepID=UPI0021192574|nr:E3 ubiquitin-protein ligase SIAH1B-like [Schistocerca nitens]